MQEAGALQKWMFPSEEEVTKEKECAKSYIGRFEHIRRWWTNQQRSG